MAPNLTLQADHLHTADPRSILQRLSRNLRQLHLSNDNPLAALVDAERVLELGSATLPTTLRGPVCINAWTAPTPSALTWNTP